MGYESISKLLKHEAPHESLAGIVIAVLSVIIMPSLGMAKKKIARQIKSRALEAYAMETIICAILSVIFLMGRSGCGTGNGNIHGQRRVGGCPGRRVWVRENLKI